MTVELQQPAESFGSDVGIRVIRGTNELVEELLVKDKTGKFRTVLLSPTHPSLGATKKPLGPSAVQGFGRGLYSEAPTFAFQTVRQRKQGKDTVVVLSRSDENMDIEKTILIPATGNVVRVGVTAKFKHRQPKIRYLLASYAFAPDGKKMKSYGRPDSTFAPGFRPKDDQVMGDHFFRAPLVSAQKGGLAALMMPDLDVMEDNRPVPMIIDLDCQNGVVDAPLLAYGFADHRTAGHVYFTHDESLKRSVPRELTLAFDLMLDADAEPFGAYRGAVPYQWDRYGHEYFNRVLPQAMPFEDYARVCYPAAFNEAYGNNKIGWFEHEINGFVCGGVPAGWGFLEGWVSWQCWFNNLRSAWGLRWWGQKLGEKDWVDKADKMLNLALAAPMDRGAVPTTYQSRTKQWKGSLIAPLPECYYDTTNMAWKGIWMLRWLEFPDCPRREEILRQCREMADLMVRVQNADGSIPTWLSKEHRVVRLLDHSAQTALPAWFLAELCKAEGKLIEPKLTEVERLAGKAKPEDIKPKIAELQDVVGRIKAYHTSGSKAADFLSTQVIDGQYYYDFETFFSCSPKLCLQKDGKVDHEAMRDHHTLQAPQNTLCMQWAAEALIGMADVDDDLFQRVAALEKGRSRGQRSAGPGKVWRSQAMKALDIMALYQNVWSLPYRKTAYTYGGFGVQNSDGEYLDARQAQFGATLCDFGARLGRRDYFERGVAATRASMTLINHPLHEQLNLYPRPNYPLGLQPENCGHGGVDHQNGRTGFDWGEGSGLASMAWLLHKYGPTYSVGGAKVLVDGGWKGRDWFLAQKPLVLTDPVFDFQDWRMPGWTVEGNFAEVPTWSDRMDFGNGGEPFIGTCEDARGGFEDEYTGTITSPLFVVTKPKIKLLVGGGAGEGVYVELVDEAGKHLAVARGKNRERMEEVTWDVAKHNGQRLRIRVVDRETGGWGHLNVGRIRCE